MDMYFKTVLVFSHFLLAAFALMAILKIDFTLVRNYDKPLGGALLDEIAAVKTYALWSLGGLYLTGALIVAYGVLRDPAYLANEKLWVKFVDVAVLTVNGFFVHALSRHVKSGIVLSRLPTSIALRLNLAGAVSSVSWVFACWLGVARAWNGTLSFATILTLYLAAVVLTAVVLTLLHAVRRQSAIQELAP